MSKRKQLTGSALATGVLFGMPVEAAVEDVTQGNDTVLEVYGGTEDTTDYLILEIRPDDSFTIDPDQDYLAQTLYGGTPDDQIKMPTRNPTMNQGGLKQPKLKQPRAKQPQLQTQKPKVRKLKKKN